MGRIERILSGCEISDEEVEELTIEEVKNLPYTPTMRLYDALKHDIQLDNNGKLGAITKREVLGSANEKGYDWRKEHQEALLSGAFSKKQELFVDVYVRLLDITGRLKTD